MKYEHNQICTKGHEVEVGGIYDYKEDSFIAEVKVIKATSDEKGIGFKLKTLKSNHNGVFPVGESFTCWAAAGHYAYSGMWRIWDRGCYTFQLS